MGLIQVPRGIQTRRGYAPADIARSPAESAAPWFWSNLIFCAPLFLGRFGARDIITRNRINETGTVTWPLDREGRVANFDAGDVLDAGPVDWTGTISIGIRWERTSGIDGQFILDNLNSDFQGFLLRVNSPTSGDIQWFIRDSANNTGTATYDAPTSASTGEPHSSIATATSGGEMQLFHDGVLRASTSSGVVTNVADHLAIGGRSGGTTNGVNTSANQFLGNIGIVHAHSRILSAAEAEELYVDPYSGLRRRPLLIPVSSATVGSQGITLAGGIFNIVPNSDLTMSGRRPLGEDEWDTNDPGLIEATSDQVQVNEDAGTVTVGASRSGGSGAASVDWTTQDGTAVAGTDYTADSNTLNWADGETGTKEVTISITDRTGTAQGDTEFSWRLSNVSGAELSDEKRVTTITILDTDGSTTEVANMLVDGSTPDGTFDYSAWWLNNDDYPNMFPVIEEFRPPEAQVGPNAPASFSGDGSNCSIATPGGGASYVDGPARSGSFSVRYALRNSAQGGDGDADPMGGNTTRRRAESYQFRTANTAGTAIENLNDRWCSVSYFVPTDWSDDGSDWGVIVLQMKGEDPARAPTNMLRIRGGKWGYRHTWCHLTNPSTPDIPWQMQQWHEVGMTGTATDDLTGDFPNLTDSENALGSLNKGGWTDWVFHIRPDYRSIDNNHDGVDGPVFGRESGGTGFIEVYKREDAGAFVHVISLHPKLITIGDMTYSRGVNYEQAGVYWALMGGMYAHYNQIDVTPSRELFVDNRNVYPSGETLERIGNRLIHV